MRSRDDIRQTAMTHHDKLVQCLLETGFLIRHAHSSLDMDVSSQSMLACESHCCNCWIVLCNEAGVIVSSTLKPLSGHAQHGSVFEVWFLTSKLFWPTMRTYYNRKGPGTLLY